MTPNAPLCAQCHTELEWGESYPTIEWDDGAPDTILCSEDCAFAWMAAKNARWLSPKAQPDVE